MERARTDCCVKEIDNECVPWAEFFALCVDHNKSGIEIMNNELIEKILKFRDDRDWKQFHNPKDLAISLSLEASELLELFQWKTSEETLDKSLSEMKEELADIMICSILLADVIGADIEEIVYDKLRQNDMKYPVDKAFGKKEKYTEL